MAFRLPRLPRTVQIVGKDGMPSLEFQRWWQSVVVSVESEFGALEAADAANAAAAAANAAAASAATAAASATTAATAAQGTADAIAADASLANSYVTGCTLTATDAGASATISVTSHTRHYGDGTDVPVNSGSDTGLAHSTLYFVYYDDPTLAGGAVTYVATTSQATAATGGTRLTVGSITTPAAAAPPETGYTVAPPGIGNIF